MSSEPATPAAGALLEVGASLSGGRYVVKARLGTGGMAEVYEAEHAALRKPVAIKVLRPEYAAMPEFRARFLREGLAASSIRHAHIVDVTDVGESDGQVYLVMELLEGETLGAFMHRQGAVPIPKAIELVLPVIAALGAAHRAGVVHRDMKPDNVLLARDAQGRTFPKVLDFGISKTTREDAPSLTSTSAVLGTPHYMSPEQARGERDVGAASDQFSLAMVLYELCTGRLPYRADTTLRLIHEVARGDVPPPSAFSSSLFDLDEPMKKALASEPADRYPTIEAFGMALLPLATPRAQSEWTAALEGRAVTPSVPPPNTSSTTAPSGRRAAMNATAPQRAASRSGPRVVPKERPTDEEDARTQDVERANEPMAAAPSSAPEPTPGARDAASARDTRGDVTPIRTPRPKKARATPTPTPTAPAPAAPVAAASPPPAAAASPRWPLLLGLGLVAAVALFFFAVRGEPRAIVVAPESAEVRVDGALVSARPVPVPTDDRAHRIVIAAPGYATRTLELAPGEEPPAAIALDPEARTELEPTPEVTPEAIVMPEAIVAPEDPVVAPEDPVVAPEPIVAPEAGAPPTVVAPEPTAPRPTRPRPTGDRPRVREAPPPGDDLRMRR